MARAPHLLAFASALLLGLSIGPREARAGLWDEIKEGGEEAGGAFTSAIGAVKAVKSLSDLAYWASCKTGGYCAPSEAYLQATRAIEAIESTFIQVQVVNSTKARLAALHMQTLGDFSTMTPLSAAEASLLMDNARSLFWDTKVYLDNAVTGDAQYVKGAYAIAVQFNIISAMYETIVNTLGQMQMFPVGMDAVSMIRSATQETNYNLIGSKEVSFDCPGSPNGVTKVNTQRGFPGVTSIREKGLTLAFADFIYHPSGPSTIHGENVDCNLGLKLVNSSAKACKMNCFFCQAASVPEDGGAVYLEQSIIEAHMDLDPVVTSLRAFMKILATQGYSSVSEYYCGATNGSIRMDYGPPALVSTASGRVDMFAQGANGAYYHKAFNGAAWVPAIEADWEPLGGVFLGPPVAVSWGFGRIEIFGQGLDLAYYRGTYDNSGFHGWSSLGGAFLGPPAAVSWGPNRIDVFGWGMDGAYWSDYFDYNTWHGWGSHGGLFWGSPTVISWGYNRLDVFGEGSDRRYAWRAWSSGWSNWTPIEGAAGIFDDKASAVTWGTNRIDLFGQIASDSQYGSSGNIVHKYFDGSTWGPASFWEDLSLQSSGQVPVMGPPAVVSAGVNQFDLLDTRTDGNVNWKAWLGWGWDQGPTASWQVIGGPAASRPAVVSHAPGQIGGAIRSAAGSVYWFGGPNSAPGSSGFYWMGKLY